eukprot:TRINITY_DN5136_c0_g1_i2.p1 TRINITY_DN5136_c0_g1~~TRINITY_DN5136_c0_g1_i2.p1  ORF type:complete len:574 (-),score=131.77 TRINITY_DN5136_c0_g1_i2:576-2297(-)
MNITVQTDFGDASDAKDAGQDDGDKALEVDAEPGGGIARLTPSRTTIRKSWPPADFQAMPSQQPNLQRSPGRTANLSEMAGDEAAGEAASNDGVDAAEGDDDITVSFDSEVARGDAAGEAQAPGVQVARSVDGNSDGSGRNDDGDSTSDAGTVSSVQEVDVDDMDKALLPAGPAWSKADDSELTPLKPEEFPGYDVTAPVQAHTLKGQVSRSQMNLALGLCFGSAAQQGNRQTMEDRTTVIADLSADARQQCSPSDSSTAPRSPSPLSPDTAALLDPRSQTDDAPPPVAFFGVYDGHGGTAVAEALQQDLHHLIVKNGLPGDPKQAVEQACLEMDEACLARDLKRMLPPPPSISEDVEDQRRRQSLAKVELSGATAAMALVLRRRDDACVRVYAANVGDCRVVLRCSGEALDLTRDHTCTHEAEKERVKTAGGVISRGRLGCVLEVTRSFGDIKCKTYPPLPGTHLWGDKQSLIAKPDIEEVEVRPVHNFLIVASDGLWNVMQSQQAVNFVQRCLLRHGCAQQASQDLVNKALQLRSIDNCSCVIVCLNQLDGASAPPAESASTDMRTRTSSS